MKMKYKSYAKFTKTLIIYSLIPIIFSLSCAKLYAQSPFFSHFFNDLKTSLQHLVKHPNTSATASPASRFEQNTAPGTPASREAAPNDTLHQQEPKLNIAIQKTKIITVPVIKKNILILGDLESHWIGEYLKSYYQQEKAIKITNPEHSEAINGSIQHYNNLLSQLEKAKNKHPDLIIISLGWQDTDEIEHHKPTTPEYNQIYLAYLRDLSQKITELAPSAKIMWLGIPPFKIRATDKYLDGYLSDVKQNYIFINHNELFKQICQENNFEYIDIWEKCLELYKNPEIKILTPDTPGFFNDALKILCEDLTKAIDILNDDAKQEQYNLDHNAEQIAKQEPLTKIYNLNELEDHTPILLGSSQNIEQNVKLLPAAQNLEAPPGRADYFNVK